MTPMTKFQKQSPTTILISNKVKRSVDLFTGNKRIVDKCLTIAETHIAIAEDDLVWSDCRAHQLIALGNILDIERAFEILFSLCETEVEERKVRKTKDHYMGKFTALKDKLEGELFQTRPVSNTE